MQLHVCLDLSMLMLLPWIWYDDMYNSNMLGFMLCHARWMLGLCDINARYMSGYAMINVWLGLFWDDWCNVVCFDVC